MIGAFILDHPMGIQPQMLPIRVGMNIIIASADKLAIDSGRETGVTLQGTGGHGLCNIRQRKHSLIKDTMWKLTTTMRLLLRDALPVSCQSLTHSICNVYIPTASGASMSTYRTSDG